MSNRICFLVAFSFLLVILACGDVANGDNSSGTTDQDATLKKAEYLYKQRLLDDAKRELVDILFSDADADIRAKSIHLLGVIALDQNNLELALNNWNELIEKYPDSEEAIKIKDKLPQLSATVSELAGGLVRDVLARSYLRHADFWSDGRPTRFTIDSSWISKIETAIEWYYVVIREYPGEEAAKTAYEHLLFTLLGWKEKRYGRADVGYGLQGNFRKYISLLLETFRSFEAEFPKAGSLQAFRYQIAQAYWYQRNWKKTREWLNEIIEKAEEGKSFYKDLAERRLKKIEY